ncbi:MAG: creatininase family protein [Ignavibacteriales bacterium]|nr:creatininase family protein [Ignavibacteriales bacterium]
MKTIFIASLFIGVSIFIISNKIIAQEEVKDDLVFKYEELTSPDFKDAVTKSEGTVIIPFGILEKHGPHLPLGTDLLDARELSIRAVNSEYSIIFPQYYFGQIFEAKHQPGTIAYSSKIIWDLLQETCSELSRNGLKKIIIVNGHGGNNNFLKYFCQAQLESRKDYAVYLYTPTNDPVVEKKIAEMRKTTGDNHAGETETATMLANRPDLVQLDKSNSQSGEDQNRLGDFKDGFTGIWWYAKYPNHYAGDGSKATKELGEFILNTSVVQLTKFIKQVKQDTKALELQKEFFNETENPLKTKDK